MINRDASPRPTTHRRPKGAADAESGSLPGPETAVFWLRSALRTHTKASYKIDLLRETLRKLERHGRARTDVESPAAAIRVEPDHQDRLVQDAYA